jgi:hypothetical protein
MHAGGVRLSDPRHVTSRFVVLAHDFSVETTDAALGQYVESVLQPFAREGRSRTSYAFVDLGPEVDERYELYFEGECQLRSRSGGSPLAYLLWHINSRAVAESNEYLLLHAAAAELGGQAVVLPAQSGSGKTTLVAGLIRSGFRYLTDEAVAIDPASGVIEPFPKPLSIKSGSWRVLPEFEPVLGPDLQRYATTDWEVDVRWIHPGAIAPPSLSAFVVSPTFRAGAETRLIPLRRTETMMLLIKNAFNLAVHGQTGLDRFAAIARQAPGYRLEVGDLDSACDVIIDLMKGEKPESHADEVGGHIG